MNHNLLAVSVFDKLSKLYEDKFMNVDAYGDSLNFFCNSLIPQTPSILDVACGPGNIAKHNTHQLPNCNYLGIDLAPKMIELAKKNVSQADFSVHDALKINEIHGNYDGIVAGFLFPYLNKNEAEKFIELSFNKLNPGGVLYISTMEFDYSKSGLTKGSTGDEIFMHYYLSQDIAKMLKANNFQIFYDQKIPLINTNDELPKNDLILIARKQNTHSSLPLSSK